MEDIHGVNSISKPLASLDTNTCDDSHGDLHNFNSLENRSLLYSNKSHADDGLVKATIMWKSVGDKVKEESNEFRFLASKVVTEQNWKSFTTTNLYKKATYGEKENLESGSGWPRGYLDFSNRSNNNAGFSGYTDKKSLQEGFEVLRKPATRLEIKVVDEAVGGSSVGICDGKRMNDCKLNVKKISHGPPTAALKKVEGFCSQKRLSDFRLEDSLCIAPSSSIQTSIIGSREGIQTHITVVEEKMKKTSCNLCSERTPLLSQSQNRSDEESFNLIHRPEVANPCSVSHVESPVQIFEEDVCGESRHWATTAKMPLYTRFRTQNIGEHSCELMSSELWKIPVLLESKPPSIQVAETSEEISTQNIDHFVVLFSAQNTKKGSAGRIIRQELLKLSSLCKQYSRKVLSWVISLARGKNTEGCLQCLWQRFTSRPRGFVKVNSQPEFLRNTSSSNKKLTKDKELKAVLRKINEVLASMERTTPDGANLRSSEGVKVVYSCSKHDCKAFAM